MSTVDQDKYCQESAEPGAGMPDPQECLRRADGFRQTRENALALAWYDRALKQEPSQPEVWNTTGLLLAGRGDLRGALDRFRQALEYDPGSLAAMINIGNILRESDDPDSAADWYRKVLKKDADNITALTNLGVLALDQSDAETARYCLRKAVALDSQNIRARYILAGLAVSDEVPVLITDLQTRRQKGTCSLDEYIEIHFALGTLYEKQERADEAFKNYYIGNSLKKRRWNLDSLLKETEALFSLYASVFTREYFEPRSPVGPPVPRMVFIVGMPRSGTTLTEQVLASHSRVYGAGELPGLMQMAARLRDGCATPDALRTRIDYFLCTTAPREADEYLGKLHHRAGQAGVIVDKAPLNFEHLWLVKLLFPDARIVYCVRDPRDTCLSCYFKNFDEGQSYSFDMQTLGHYYRLHEKLMQHWRSVMGEEILPLSYESMVDNLEEAARGLLAFCDLPWEDRVLQFYHTKRTVKTASRSQVIRPIYRTSLARWKKYTAWLGPLFEALGQGNGSEPDTDAQPDR